MTKWPPFFADGIFKCIVVNEKFYILLKISLKFIPKGPIDNNPALVQVMVCAEQATSHYLNQWWPSSLMHICGTRGRWVKSHQSKPPPEYNQISVNSSRESLRVCLLSGISAKYLKSDENITCIMQVSCVLINFLYFHASCTNKFRCFWLCSYSWIMLRFNEDILI